MFLEVLKPFVPVSLLEIDLHHALRLILIVCGYAFLRNVVSKYLATKQLKQQLEKDESERDLNKIKELVDDPQDNADSTSYDNGNWGFGKKTRRSFKRKEKILKEELENLHAHEQYDSDKDIEDLLED